MNGAWFFDMWNSFVFAEPPGALGTILPVYTVLVAAGLLCSIFLLLRHAKTPLRWEQNAKELVARTASWRWSDIRAMVLMLFFLQLLVFWFSEEAKRRSWTAASWPEWAWVAVNGAAFHVAGLAMIAFLLWRKGASWHDTFGATLQRLRQDIGKGVLFYLAMLPVFLFAAFVYGYLLSQWGVEPEFQDIVAFVIEEKSVSARLTIIIMAFLVGPLFEEIFFRGLALPLMARSRSMGAAVVATSLVFAGMHMSLTSFFPLFAIAVAFSLVYIATKSIVAPVAMHAVFNAVNLTLIMAGSEL